MNHKSLFVILLTTAAVSLHARAPQEVQSELKRHVGYLASEELAGRMTGSAGARQAADYLASELKAAGLKPGGEKDTYFQEFEYSAGVEILPGKNSLEIVRPAGTVLEPEKNFRPLAFTGNASVEGEVVFAGYGLRAPGQEGKGYNSYGGVDVKDKIVLVLRYSPEDAAPARKAELNRYAGLRYKAMLAREHGAKAILVVTGPNSPGAGELVPITSDAGMGGSEIPAVSIDEKTAAALLAGSGKSLKDLQAALDAENPHADSGFVLKDTTVKLSAAVERLHKPDANVLGLLPPAGGAKEYVILGAHYDHLGHGEAGAMKRKGEETDVHYGADDNASGVSLVLEAAKLLAADRKKNPDQPARGVVFAFWSGEEIGIIGSSHFAEHPTVPLSEVVAYLNFDMVGRLRDNRLSVQGVGSSLGWKKLLEKRNVAGGFTLALQDDPYLPTDSTAFYPKTIPVLNFFTGSHDDYHRPTDTADKINYEGLERITRLAKGVTADLIAAAERPDYVKVERSDSGGTRDALRIYIGSIPDYASEVSGVKVSGARGGSPADKAGLKAGDVIVEFAGQKITNIYDYTYALDAAKIGQPLIMKVQRDGQTVDLEVIPEGRK